MLKVNDEFTMVKPIGNMDVLVGQKFKAIDVKDGLIHFACEGLGTGFMSEDEFPRYFKVVRTWTPWMSGGLYDYRTDGSRYVEVRRYGTKKRASCHPLDEFDLLTGITVALCKLTAEA